MFFKFFNKLSKDTYSFKEFKEFCNILSSSLSIQKQKKIVKKAHNTYINALKGYDKVIGYRIEAIKDVDKCSDVIDLKGKKYFKKTIDKELSKAMIDSIDLDRRQESEVTLSINSQVKNIIEWKYK